MTAVAVMATAIAGVAALAAKVTAPAAATTATTATTAAAATVVMVMTMAMLPAMMKRTTNNDDTTVAAVRAAGATKTTKVTAMAGGTNNNQLKAQLCPAHDGNKDDTPGMYLAVVVVATMTVWEGRSTTATVEEAATVAADEADNGRAGDAVQFFFLFDYFSCRHCHCH